MNRNRNWSDTPLAKGNLVYFQKTTKKSNCLFSEKPYMRSCITVVMPPSFLAAHLAHRLGREEVRRRTVQAAGRCCKAWAYRCQVHTRTKKSFSFLKIRAYQVRSTVSQTAACPVFQHFIEGKLITNMWVFVGKQHEVEETCIFPKIFSIFSEHDQYPLSALLAIKIKNLISKVEQWSSLQFSSIHWMGQ